MLALITPRHLLAAAGLATLLVLASAPGMSAASDPAVVADAYGDVAVFILNVAAGNDGVPQQPRAEQTYRQAFAELFAGGYANLQPDEQESLSTLPELDTQLHAAWPNLPVDQRNGLRDQWAAGVQQMAADMPCDELDGLARAQLLPSYGQYQQININRLRQCWHDHPELTRDSQEQSSGQRFGSSPGGMPGGGSHSTFMAMFNANLYSYTASMNSASMGTATYTVKSFP
jgi:hypothetical protein